MQLKSLPHWAWAGPALAVGMALGIVIGKSGRDGAGSSSDRGVPPRASGLSGRESRGGVGADDRSPIPRGTFASGSSAAAYALTLLDSSSRLERVQRLLTFLDQLPDDQFAEVYSQFADSPLGRDRRSELSLVLQAWAERDPYAATAYLQENGAQDWERETALSTWAAYDPQGAFAWAMAAEDAGRVNNWVVGALSGIASASPELARDLLLSVGNGDTQRAGLRSIEAAIVRQGFAATEAWVAGLEPGSDLHSRAARYFADDLASIDPAGAGRWAASLTDTNTRREVSERVSEEWAETDLEGARAWVESLPADTVTEAAEGLIEEWAGRDPAAASQWLASLGDTAELDGARRQFVRETWRSHPEAALGMSTSLSNSEDRDRVMGWTLRRWAREDPDAARNWVEANPTAVTQEMVDGAFR